MAIEPTFGNVYWAGWSSPSGARGYLYINERGVIATPAKLLLKADSLQINYNFSDWNEPIIGLQAQFEIINDRDDFFELMPLLIAQEGQYNIQITIISPYEATLFDGFLNCDTIKQKYLHRQSIAFTASNYILKLENLNVTEINTLQNLPIINAIDSILQSTGSFFNIRINSTLHATGDLLGALDTLFNKNGFYTEVFWEDNVTRVNSLEILKAILTSFDCYIYWFDGFWYIERYEDLGKTTITYIEYITGSTYGPTIPGSSSFEKTQTAIDVHSIHITNQSQNLSTIPGYKEIEIDLDDKRMFNLLIPDLTKAETSTINPTPSLRKWLYTEDAKVTWDTFGKVHSTILNSVKRTVPNAHISTGRIQPNIGLSSMFLITIESQTEITLQFKFGVTGAAFDRSKWDFYFHYYIRENGTSNYLTNNNDVWSLSPQVSEINGMQKTMISGSSFDPITFVAEVSVSIPIGQATAYKDGIPNGKLLGDKKFIVFIGSEMIVASGVIPGDSWNYDEIDQAEYAWIGDIAISTTGINQPNIIKGKVNDSGFLNKKTIKLLLYDSDSYDYKNGILRGDSLEYRTEGWGDAGGAANCIARGVVWNTTGSPTLEASDPHTVDGAGFGTFSSQITGLLKSTHYFVRAYGTDADGLNTYGNTQEFTTTALEIGFFYQGGYIFYICQPGDAGYEAGVTHGLIASPSQFTGTSFWGRLAGGGTYSPGAYETGVESYTGAGGIYLLSEHAGKDNTETIVASDYQDQFGCKIITDYGTPDYPPGTWYWPSVYELWLMKVQKTKIPGMVDNWYWSSTEPGGIYCAPSPSTPSTPNLWGSDDVTDVSEWKFAWAVNMADTTRKNPDTWRKNNNMCFRAIRYF